MNTFYEKTFNRHYINCDEDISPDLIKEKVSRVLENVV